MTGRRREGISSAIRRERRRAATYIDSREYRGEKGWRGRVSVQVEEE